MHDSFKSYLHCNWEVILGFWGKENVHSLLLERRVTSGWCSNLDYVKFPPCSSSDSKAEQSTFLLIAFHLKLDKSSRVSLYRLRHLPLNAVELHGSHHPVLLSRDPNQEQPVLSRVCSVVNNLK